MKIFYCIIISWLVLLKASVVYLQTPNAYPFSTQEGKFGLIDSKGNLIVEPIFDLLKTSKYSEYIIANKVNYWGVINSKGEQVLDFSFYSLNFAEESDIIIASKKIDGIPKFGFINRNLEFIDSEYSELRYCNKQDMLIGKNGRKEYLIKLTGEVVFEYEREISYLALAETSDKDVFLFWKGENHGFLNREGQIIIDPLYSHYDLYPEAGLLRVGDIKRKVSYFTNTGKELNRKEFYNRLLKPGEFAIDTSRSRPRAYVNHNGDFVFEDYIIAVQEFTKQGVAIAKNNFNYKFGIINSKGKWNAKPIYDRVESIGLDNKAVIINNNKDGLIDLSGEVILSPRFQHIGEFKESCMCRHAFTGKSNNIIDENGQVIFNNNGGGIRSLWGGAFFALEEEGVWTIYSREGEEISSLEVDYLRGTASVDLFIGKLKNNFCGYINKKGEWAINPVFEKCGKFDSNDVAEVKKDGLLGIINKQGEFFPNKIINSKNTERTNNNSSLDYKINALDDRYVSIVVDEKHKAPFILYINDDENPYLFHSNNISFEAFQFGYNRMKLEDSQNNTMDTTIFIGPRFKSDTILFCKGEAISFVGTDIGIWEYDNLEFIQNENIQKAKAMFDIKPIVSKKSEEIVIKLFDSDTLIHTRKIAVSVLKAGDPCNDFNNCNGEEDVLNQDCECVGKQSEKRVISNDDNPCENLTSLTIDRDYNHYFWIVNGVEYASSKSIQLETGGVYKYVAEKGDCLYGETFIIADNRILPNLIQISPDDYQLHTYLKEVTLTLPDYIEVVNWVFNNTVVPNSMGQNSIIAQSSGFYEAEVKDYFGCPTTMYIEVKLKVD